ncbi:caspase recruitment domain-containing protein 11-like isoform X2 [Ptychodera flava]
MGDWFDETRTHLEDCRLEIVKYLDPERIFDDLRAKKVLDAEDCEEIACRQKYPTRQSRAGKFLDILLRKGPSAYEEFCKILERRHPYLYKVITKKEPEHFSDNEDDFFLQYSVQGISDSSTFADLAQKYNTVGNEKKILQSELSRVTEREKELTREVEKLKKKVESHKRLVEQNKRLRTNLREYEDRLHQVTEEKCDAVQRSLNYQADKELASSRLHQALLETEELRRKLNRLEGDCAFERSQSIKLRNELKTKPKASEVDELKRENQLLKAELNKYMSNENIRQSVVLKDENDQIAILQSERESAQNELKHTVDQLFSVRQECHAAEEERNKFSEQKQQLEQENSVLRKDCETFKRRKEELFKQLMEREKERNQAIRDRDKAQSECATMTQERDEYYGKLYHLQDEFETVAHDLRELKKQQRAYVDSGSDQGCRALLSPSIDTDGETMDVADPSDDAGDGDDGKFQARNGPFRKRSIVISRSNSRRNSSTQDAPATPDDAFKAFNEWHSTEDLYDYSFDRGGTPKTESQKVHPPTVIKHRAIHSRKIFSMRNRCYTLDDLSDCDSNDDVDYDGADNADTGHIHRREGLRRRDAGTRVRRSMSCSELTRALEEMIVEENAENGAETCSSVEARSSLTESSVCPSIPTSGSRSTTTSDYISDTPVQPDDLYEVLLYCTSLTGDFEITGGNTIGIFIKSVKPNSKAKENGILVGDQILKITGNIGAKHCSKSLVDNTLEQALRSLNMTGGWIKVSMKHNQAVFEKYRADDNNIYGDSFYVRAHFRNEDKKKEGNSELYFEPGDVLHVMSTARGGIYGVWHAQHVNTGESGIIPNYNKAYEKLMIIENAGKTMSLKRFATGSMQSSAVGCFPIEKKTSFLKKKGSFDPKKMKKYAEQTMVPYTFVKAIKVSEPRPLLMVGASGLVNMVQKQLTLSDMTKDKFEICETEEIVCTEEEMDQQKKETGDIVDSVREGGNFKCLTIANIKKVTKKGKHALCYINEVGGALAKLYAARIYPMIVVLSLRDCNEKDHPTVFILGENVDKMRQQLRHAEESVNQLNLFYPKSYETKIVDGVDRTSINNVVTTLSEMVKRLNSDDIYVAKEGRSTNGGKDVQNPNKAKNHIT